MTRVRAAIGTLVFLLVAPGVVAGVIPWLLTDWNAQEWWPPLRLLGGLLTVAGLAVLLHAFTRFVLEGLGTPAPVAPPERLVVRGAYRCVRNPMYVAVVALVAGQGLLLGQAELLLYAGGLWALFAAFVRYYEEPRLSRQFGSEYDAYRREVPAWWPRRPTRASSRRR